MHLGEFSILAMLWQLLNFQNSQSITI